MPQAFRFDGRIPPSKSLMNRWLCVASYAKSEFRIHGDSSCDDVVYMRQALAALQNGSGEIPCGAAGTVLRFMALRASRVPGHHRLIGSKRLFERPQQELCALLAKLGVKAELRGDALEIESSGWKAPAAPIEVDRSVSSQFASSLVLNAWNLDFPLSFRGSVKSVSDSYFDMTLAVAREAGMTVNATELVEIPASQRVTASEATPEPDMSSAFAVAALGVAGGEAVLQDFPARSLQPDHVFPSILQAMGAKIKTESGSLRCSKSSLHGVSWNLRDCPDLFPVLAALCALGQGKSKLHGAVHLALKESDRIARVATLIEGVGGNCVRRSDGIEISAERGVSRTAPFEFDPADDHRMVMAAAVLRAAGCDVRIKNIDCVKKSFPEFIAIAGLS